MKFSWHDFMSTLLHPALVRTSPASHVNDAVQVYNFLRPRGQGSNQGPWTVRSKNLKRPSIIEEEKRRREKDRKRSLIDGNKGKKERKEFSERCTF